MSIRIKRIYEPAARDDGLRVLVDRLWPRGVSKGRAKVDQWLKQISPSDALRKKFHHDPAKWNEFRSHYFNELDREPDVVAQLRREARRGPVTLLFAARDEVNNNAAALKQYLSKRRRSAKKK
jgi:uncharacterized protein YeaO (DUF488 family)